METEVTKKKSKKKNQKKKDSLLVLLLLFLALSVAGGVVLLSEVLIYLDNKETNARIEAYVEYFDEAETEEDTAEETKGGTGKDAGDKDQAGSADTDGQTDTGSVSSQSAAISSRKIYSVDFVSIQAINPEVVAWIEVPGTKVSYPVLFKSGDSDYYLTHTVENGESKAGAIHLDGDSNGTESRNLLIYGHNLADYTMFSSLHSYKNYSFWQGNPYIYLYLPNGSIRQYLIAAVVLTDKDADPAFYMLDFSDDESAQSYYDNILSQSIFDTGVSIDAAEGKQTILLSTCYRSKWKRLILAVQVN